MGHDNKSDLENEFIQTLLSAMRKGMTAEEFFAMADATLNHLRGKTTNETVEKIIQDSATPDEVKKMIESFQKKQ